MTTAALLRAAARIARADAALVDVDGCEVHTVFGLSDAAAADVLAAIESGRPLADGRVVAWESALAFGEAGRRARLSVIAGGPLSFSEDVERVLRLLAGEIGYELGIAVATDRRSIVTMLGDRIEQLAAGVDSIADPVAIYEAPRIGNVPLFIYVNAPFVQLFGFNTLDLIGQAPDLMHGAMTDSQRIEFLRDRIRAGQAARSTVVLYKRDGIPVWVDIDVRPVHEPSGAVSFYISTMRDVTARKEFEDAVRAEKNKLQVTLAAIGDAVFTTVADGRIEFVNAAARMLFGIDSVEAYGETIGAILPLTDSAGRRIDVLQAGDDDAGARRGQGRVRMKKRLMEIAFVTSPISDPPVGYVVVMRDVTAQHRLAKELSFQAAHDPLTGLVNRRRFEDLLNTALITAQTQETTHTLAFLDLDRFKIVNDRCGHAVGDRVLSDVARILSHNVRGNDVVARLGGDEFAILLEKCSIANARRVLEKLRVAVEDYRVEHAGETLSVGVSIGLAPMESTTSDAASALAAADAACYAAKAAGRNVIVG